MAKRSPCPHPPYWRWQQVACTINNSPRVSLYCPSTTRPFSNKTACTKRTAQWLLWDNDVTPEAMNPCDNPQHAKLCTKKSVHALVLFHVSPQHEKNILQNEGNINTKTRENNGRGPFARCTRAPNGAPRDGSRYIAAKTKQGAEATRETPDDNADLPRYLSAHDETRTSRGRKVRTHRVHTPTFQE